MYTFIIRYYHALFRLLIANIDIFVRSSRTEKCNTSSVTVSILISHDNANDKLSRSSVAKCLFWMSLLWTLFFVIRLFRTRFLRISDNLVSTLPLIWHYRSSRDKDWRWGMTSIFVDTWKISNTPVYTHPFFSSTKCTRYYPVLLDVVVQDITVESNCLSLTNVCHQYDFNVDL